MKFLYVMDPMCAWCYGFQPELAYFLAQYSSIEIDWIMGGLAPDTTQPMDDDLKQTISAYWHQIEAHTAVTFNHDYWKLNTPYRSTYLACRAVITAEDIVERSAPKMVQAIQSAYYREAKNPSLETTLVDCAKSIGLDENQFLDVLKSEKTEHQLQQNLSLTRQLQVGGFPALFYIDDAHHAYPLTLGFCKAQDLQERFSQINQDNILV